MMFHYSHEWHKEGLLRVISALQGYTTSIYSKTWHHLTGRVRSKTSFPFPVLRYFSDMPRANRCVFFTFFFSSPIINRT